MHGSCIMSVKKNRIGIDLPGMHTRSRELKVKCWRLVLQQRSTLIFRVKDKFCFNISGTTDTAWLYQDFYMV